MAYNETQMRKLTQLKNKVDDVREKLGTVKNLFRQQIALLERERHEGTLAVAPARYAQEVQKMLRRAAPSLVR
jgi:hypothetical protein